MEVIPVINCLDGECVGGALETFGAFLPEGSWVHLDVADGLFTFHKTWNTPARWAELGGGRYKLEVHLMVEEPERAVDAWLDAGAKRLIVHYEALEESRFRAPTVPPADATRYIRDAATKRGAEVFLAVDPATPVAGLREKFSAFDGAQILAVNPGLPGQKFLPLTLDKIRQLRRELPDIKIEVDGGINAATAASCRAAGADMLAAGTYILQNQDHRKAYEELQNV